MARAFVYPTGHPKVGQPLSFARGEAVTLTIAVKQADVGQTGEDTAQNVSGWTTQLTLTPDCNTLAKTLTKAGVVLVAASGTITFTLSRAETKDLEPGVYEVDVFRTDSGSERKLAYGTIIVEGGALHPAAS